MLPIAKGVAFSVQSGPLFAGFGLGAGTASAMPFAAAIGENRLLLARCAGSGFGAASHIAKLGGERFANWRRILIAALAPFGKDGLMPPAVGFKLLS
nr:hypothetical protein [Methylomonas koyamae]